MMRSTDRLAACSKQLDAFQLPFELVSAVNGEELAASTIHELYNYAESPYHKHLTKGEIGCYLSHIRVWQKIVDEQLDYALVLEDDVLLQDNIQQGLDAIQDIRQPWDLIKLAEAPIKRKAVHTLPLNEFSLVSYNKVPSRTCAQVISLSGAKKLLANSTKIKRPIDIEIQHWWASNLKVFGLQPYIVKANKQVESEIDRTRSREQSNQSRFRKFIRSVQFYFKNKSELKKRLRQLK